MPRSPGGRPASPAVEVSARGRRETLDAPSRARILDAIIRDEITRGARVDHRDTVSGVLVKGGDRLLVTIDEAGLVNVDRLVNPRARRGRWAWTAIAALTAAVVVLVVATQLGLAR